MSGSWVLKFPRSDDPGCLLLQVSPNSDIPLDLNLLATEGESPYKGKIRQRKIAELRSRNFHASGDDVEAEWKKTLQQVFNPQSLAAESLVPPAEHGKGLETVTSVSKGKATITLRHRIDKITQRLGSVELLQDDDAEIQLFDWCSTAVGRAATLEAEKAELGGKYDSAQATITTLETRLEELVKAKTEYEEQLVSKFVLLLNEKKLKIRNQQRLLSTAKIDPTKLREMEKTLESKGRGNGKGKGKGDAAQSGTGKRQAEEEAEDNDSSDGFEKMDVDAREGKGEEEVASSARGTTPETETETEEEAEAEAEAAAPSNNGKPSTESTTEPHTTQPKKPRSSPPPPTRQLPFKRKAAQNDKATGSRSGSRSNDQDEDQAHAPTTRSQGHPQAKAKAKAEAEAAARVKGDRDDETASEGDDEL